METSSDRRAALELVRCRRVNVSGSQFVDPTPAGVDVEDCADVVITGCTVVEDRAEPRMDAAIRWRGEAAGSLVAACRLGKGTEGSVVGPEGLRREMNVEG